MYEAHNTFTRCNLKFDFPVKEAYITNMIEENVRNVAIENNEISIDFKAFEIVTLRLVVTKKRQELQKMLFKESTDSDFC